MRVLDCHCGLADTTEPLQGMRQYDSYRSWLAWLHRSQTVKDVVPAGEVLDALRDVAPDQRNTT